MESMAKELVFDPTLCTGCMRCMTTCSTYNFGATSLSKSRIQIVRHEGHAITRIDEPDELIFFPMTCRQCETPYCQKVCPVNAIQRKQDTGAMRVDYDKCIGCRMCMVGCPFGAVRYDSVRKLIFKCELCEGEPQCVKFCPTEALQFVPMEVANLPKMNARANRLMQLHRAVVLEADGLKETRTR